TASVTAVVSASPEEPISTVSPSPLPASEPPAPGSSSKPLPPQAASPRPRAGTAARPSARRREKVGEAVMTGLLGEWVGSGVWSGGGGAALHHGGKQVERGLRGLRIPVLEPVDEQVDHAAGGLLDRLVHAGDADGAG